MNFAGQKYTYISKKKIEKLHNIRAQSQSQKSNQEDIKSEDNPNEILHQMDVIKEELGESVFDETIKEFLKEDPNSENKIKLEPKVKISESSSEKIIPKRTNAFAEKNSEKSNFRRSRSNSLEKNIDEELDNVYSCSDEEDNQEEKEIENNSSNLKNENETKSEGFFSRVGNTFKNIFSGKKKKSPPKKKVLYSVSELNRNRMKEIEKTYEHEVDTNILSLKFEFLKDMVEYTTGDPILCKCDAVFNLHSNLTKIENSHKSIWLCEFCGDKNEILIEKEEIPTTDCLDFFVQSSNQLNKGMKGLNYNDEQSLIFCFDVSGSMCVTTAISGKHQIKGNYFDKMKNDLMSFSDGSDQFYGNGTRNVTYVSRLQCLQAAIESNFNQLLKEAPNRKVGFVTFNNEIIAYGDCSKDPVKINGNNLNNFEFIQTTAESSQHIITRSIKDSQNNLLKQLFSIEETGQTSLGPAVLFTIKLIPGISPGSRIILCTDGISNMGIGSMEDKKSLEEIEELKVFYKNLGLIAKSKGVIIDLITFEDEQSNIDVLMHMIEETGGEIIRVKPTEILSQFSNLLTNQVVASNVKVKVKLHKLMQFRNDDENLLQDNGSTLVKELGNVTKETELYVEYSFRPSEEIARFQDVDVDSLKFVSFQSIIDYTNLTGDRCIRVLTKQQQICMEKEIVRKQANYDIISTNAIQKTSKLAKEGSYREAQSHALAWKKFIKNSAEDSVSANKSYKVYSQNMNNFNNDMQELQFKKLTSQDVMQNNSKKYF